MKAEHLSLHFGAKPLYEDCSFHFEDTDKIGVVGTVPFEASDNNHIHVEVKVNGTHADPISFINNED